MRGKWINKALSAGLAIALAVGMMPGNISVKHADAEITGSEDSNLTYPLYRYVKDGVSEYGLETGHWEDQYGNIVNQGEEKISQFSMDEECIGASMPSSYNTDHSMNVTSPKNQYGYGLCWAFSSIGAVESSLVANGMANRSVDLSERHLGYFAHTPNEGGSLSDGTNISRPYEGGNFYQAAGALVRWNGTATESEYPYMRYNMTKLTEADRNKSNYHLKGFYLLPDNRDVIKEYIKKDGGVAASFYFSEGTTADNGNDVESYFYSTNNTQTNHGILIVGWDDNYNVASSPNTAPARGAWLCKNSWGDTWSDDGYFWISYSEGSLQGYSVFEMEEADQYNRLFTYNGAYSGGYYDLNTKTMYISNIFNVSGSSSIGKVGFYTQNDGVNYEVSIYKSSEIMSGPTDGTKVDFSSGISGTADYAGYHTVDLNSQISLSDAKQFSVVIKLYGNTALRVPTEVGSNYTCMGRSYMGATINGMRSVSTDLYINAYGSSSVPGSEPEPGTSAASKNVYTDSACTATAPMQTIFVNGSKVGAIGAKVNYKTSVLYSNLQPSSITTISRGRVVTKKGKIVAGVTMSNGLPTLVKGKITDADAAKIAKVTYKKGKLTITARKNSGVVYAWLLDTGDNKGYAYVKVDTNMAPTKMILQTDELAQQNKTLTKAILPMGDKFEFKMKPTYDKNGSVAQDASYTATVDKKSQQYLAVAPSGDTGYIVRAIGMNSSKPGSKVTGKVIISCDQNTRKAVLTVTVTNPVKSVDMQVESNCAVSGSSIKINAPTDRTASIANVKLSPLAESADYKTTDACKVAMISSAEGFSFNSKGKLIVSRPSGDAAKIKLKYSKRDSRLTITLPKKLSVGTTAYMIVSYSSNAYRVYKIEVV